MRASGAARRRPESAALRACGSVRRSRAVAASWLVVSAAACAPTNTAPNTVTVPLGLSVARAAPPLEEPPAEPDDVRCGVDDVEVARRLDEPSSIAITAAPHHASTKWTGAPSVNPPTAFYERVEACKAAVFAADAGKLSFDVRFAASGVATWVRPLAPQSKAASPFAGCLARAACLLQEGKGEHARTRETIFETSVEAPVFIGQVAAHPLPSVDPKTGKRTRSPVPLADAERAGRLAEQVALGCAFARPPSETFSFEITFTFEAGTEPRLAPFAASPEPYLAYIAQCLQEGVRSRLPKTPGRTGPPSTLRFGLRVMYLRDAPGQL